MQTELETRDPTVVWQLLGQAYGSRLHLTGERGAARCVHRDLGRVLVDDLDLDVAMTGAGDGAEWLVVAQVRAGWVEYAVGGVTHRLGPGEVMPVTGPHTPFRIRTSPASRQRIVGIRPDALRRAAHDRGLSDPGVDPARSEPLGVAEAVPWRTLTAYLAETETTHPRTFASPLAASACSQLVAQTALSLFGAAAGAEPVRAELAGESQEGWTTAVRRAIAFIESEADTDLTLADIAAAAHVTPRALQYGFRRLLDTTPMAYLRRVRLQHVRAELLDAAPGTTVAEVAGRWGFFHLGRFAGYYRGEFGENPAQTLDA